jgi:hypothetical protein
MRTRSVLLFFGASFLVYNLNMRVIATGDSLPARFLPFSVLKYGTVWLDPVIDVTRGNHRGPYWFLKSKDGHFASLYPLVTPLLVTPLYVPAVARLSAEGWTDDRLAAFGEVMEKVSASVVASVAAALFYLLMLRVAPRSALLLSVAFAFGTNTWATSSQALWQHGAAEILAVVALLCLTQPPTPARLAGAGLACGLLVVNRLPDVCLAAGFAFGVLWIAPRLFATFAAAAIAGAAPFFAYNIRAFGVLGGGYVVALNAARAAGDSPFVRPILPGLAGLLVSPGKGLLVFSPFLLFLLGSVRRRFAEEPGRKLAVALALGVIAQLFVYAMADFRAGWCYGPRFTTDAAPILVWMVAPVVESLHGAMRRLFVLAVVFSIAVQAIGAFCYPRGASDTLMDVNPWKPASTPFVVEARAGLASPLFLESLLRELRATGNTR